MFTRAGLDLRRARVILIYARVAIVNGNRSGWACLLRFRSGDYAWYCKNPDFLCWGLRAHIFNHPKMWLPYGVLNKAPSSEVDCEEAIAWREANAKK